MNMRRAVSVVVGVLVFASAWAFDPRLVTNINALGSGTPVHAEPTAFSNQGSWSIFQAREGDSVQFATWGTDGTFAGTQPLDRFVPFPTGPIANFVRLGNESFLFMRGSNGQRSALWALNGTAAGTRLVKDLGAEPGVENGIALEVFNNKLILFIQSPQVGNHLWMSDGTSTGTQVLWKSANGSGSALDRPIFQLVDRFVFIVSVPSTGALEFWESNGTAAGTRLLTSIPDNANFEVNSEPILAGRTLLYLTWNAGTSNTDLWGHDIDTGSTTLFLADAGFSRLETPATVGGVAVFRGNLLGGSDGQLWRSDGTLQGTFMIPGAAPEQSASDKLIHGPLPTGRLVYIGSEASSPDRVWSTDGTTAQPLSAGNTTSLVSLTGSYLYFVSASAGPTFGLWRTDGTAAGTMELPALTTLGVSTQGITGDDDTIYFRRSVGQPGQFTREIYRYDVASDMPLLLHTYQPLTGQSTGVFSSGQGLLYFDSNSPETGLELWVSDGTVGGTHLLRNIAPETGIRSASPAHFANLGALLYFVADDGITGRELWRSNGNEFGTNRVFDANAGPDSSDMQDLFSANGQLFFFARDSSGAFKLWGSDGTTAGTRPLADLSPVTQMPNRPLRTCGGARGIVVGGQVYFPAFSATGGVELWRSDGTPSGTVGYDLNNGAEHSDPCWLMEHAGSLYFTANGGAAQNNVQVWKVDGVTRQAVRVTNHTPAPTPGEPEIPPANLTSFKGALFLSWIDGTRRPQLLRIDNAGSMTEVAGFPAEVGITVNHLAVLEANTLLFNYRSQLWESDGTTPGTGRLGAVGPSSSTPIFVQGGKAYFSGAELDQVGGAGFEPWVSDGTEAGTRRLRDINAGAGSSSPSLFTEWSGVTVFQVEGANGPALWQTDGTTEGTFGLHALGTGVPTTNYPLARLGVGQTYFLASDNGTSGVELFAFDDGAPIVGPDTASVQAGRSVSIQVLASDADIGGTVDASTLRIETAPGQGTAVVSGSAITFAAPAGFTGNIQFTYSVADDLGQRSVPATVTVQVSAPPSPPPPPTSGSGGSGGGGGSLGIACLVALLSLLCSVPVRRQRARRFPEIAPG